MVSVGAWLWYRFGGQKVAAPLAAAVEHASASSLPTVREREELPDDGIVLGRVLEGDRVGKRLVVTQGTTGIVVGPTGAGKTQKVLLPAVLRHRGPLLTTSTKDELAAEAFYVASGKGTVSVLDPAQVVSNENLLERSVVWTPLQDCETFGQAGRTVAQIAMLKDGDVWGNQATALLATVLWILRRYRGTTLSDIERLLQALRTQKSTDEVAVPPIGKSFTQLVQHITKSPECGWAAASGAIGQLAKNGEIDAVDAGLAMDVLSNMEGIASAEETIAGVIFSLNAIKNTSLIYCRDAWVAPWDADYNIDLGQWAESEADSVFIVSPDSAKNFEGYFCAFIAAAMNALDAAAWANEKRALPNRALLVLDELANICPLPDLPAWLSTKRSQNIAFLLGVQGMSQLASRYTDDGANTIVNNGNMFNLALAGSQDNKTVDHFSKFAGERQETTKTVSTSKTTGTSRSIGFGKDSNDSKSESTSKNENVSVAYRGLATPYGLFQMPWNQGVALLPSHKFVRLRCLPAYEDEQLKAMKQQAVVSFEEKEARKSEVDMFKKGRQRLVDEAENVSAVEEFFPTAYGDHSRQRARNWERSE
ncbi:type IV secretory system conjugative DNA transfer family protein [Gordonia sputi]|uniref:type IV secretory system conjugative DNA transfer family protein n=1 Tax=Gordonia sputi TaxID=36823 RepID=UPI0036AE5F8E